MKTPELRPWSARTAKEQLSLRDAYGNDPACLTGTCSLDAKTAHFAAWLADRGVAFSAEDLRRAH
jgi:hypothetical protein